MNGPHQLFLRHGGRICSAVAGGSAAVLLGRSLRRDEIVDATQQQDHRHFLFHSKGQLTFCEGAPDVPSTSATDSDNLMTEDTPEKANSQDDDYPNFSRHGSKAALPKFLTPQLYQQLKDLKTPKFGVTLDDMIRAGTMLPYGANPPRGVGGVYTGDADCYRVFAPLLIPLLEEYHGVTLVGDTAARTSTTGHHHRPLHHPYGSFQRPTQLHNVVINRKRTYNRKREKSSLKRHTTNLDPEQIVHTELDPTGEYILYTRMRLARNIDGFAFCSHISRSDRRQIQRLFQTIVDEDFRPYQGGAYIPIHAMTNPQHDDFMSRRICCMDPDEFKIAAGQARDWPDARGIYGCRNWDDKKSRHQIRRRRPSSPLMVRPTQEEIELWEESPPNIIMWNNYDDHFWIISVNKGGDVQGVFKALSDAVRQLELSLLERGHAFCEHPKLGFLTSSPSNVGTALRASMSVKLVRLGKQHPVLFQEILDRLHLEAKSDYAETDQRYTGIYDIANAERLGRTEVQWINVMIEGVAKLIELEKKLERGEAVSLQDVEKVGKNVES
ncbi:Creatine kinase [Seminavis robusta]|uniref:Creatine kinase n=1 Tax=Seminavis robusta TaxID=568900 RepID=A0A9N8E617_9STRA|nr:Creatine kinase [Seminavis robusta]|eukprot:Sro535_g162020.1 Creatine kinase (553) ;mRNA; f:52479-54137